MEEETIGKLITAGKKDRATLCNAFVRRLGNLVKEILNRDLLEKISPETDKPYFSDKLLRILTDVNRLITIKDPELQAQFGEHREKIEDFVRRLQVVKSRLDEGLISTFREFGSAINNEVIGPVSREMVTIDGDAGVKLERLYERLRETFPAK